MSTRAKVAAAAVSASVIALGWQIGTANGQAASGTATANGSTTSGGASTTTGNGNKVAAGGRTTQSANTTATQSSSTGSYQNGTFTGQAVSYRYGQLAVTVTVAGGKITNVSAQVQSDGDRKSDMINSQAIPMMKTQVLAANSADVSTIGGATFTTEAYLTSLQSALDKAR